ncbi:MAG: cytochrome P460 family protein [Sandaracinaceae bacterium]|nr:cytochrome P460 family protein [Sandaracinaceae bacterium]
MPHAGIVLGVTVALAAGCEPEPSSPFPDGFPEGWTEAREACTLSHDHDLTYIRVYANELAYGPYTTFEGAYPPGAMLLKQLFYDEDCRDLVGFVTMEKLPEGTQRVDFDWRWRRFDARGEEIVDPRRIPDTCITCHHWHCAAPPYGWDLTCSQEGLEPPTPFPGGG